MTNEIKIGLNVTGEQKAKRALNETGDAAEKAGDKFEGMGKDAGFLNRQVIQTSGSLQELITQLDKTGDASLEKGIRQAERDLRKWQRLAKQLMPQDDTPGLGSQITSGLGSAAAAAGPLKLGGAAIGAAALPLLGASVSAAVLGGVGAGGIIGGIALAADDPEVQAAGTDLAATLSSSFGAAAAPFTAPLVDSLNELKGTAANAAGELAPGFAALAKTIEPLTDGIDGLVDNALPGVTKAMKSAAPVIRLVADELPELGQELGDFLSKVSDDPDGAILAMKTLFDVTGQAIEGTGNLVAGLSAVYEGSVRGAAAATGALEDVLGWVPWVGNIYSSTNDDLEAMLASLDKANSTTDDLATSTDRLTVHTFGLGVAADGTAESLQRERDAMKELVDLEIQRIRGTIGIERALDNLAEARKENGRTLDVETEAGRRNTEEILDNIEAVQRNAEVEYQLALQHGATAEEAERAAKTYRDKWGRAVAEQTTHLYGNTAAVQALLEELKKLDGRKFTYTVIQKGGQTIGYKAPGGIQLAGDEGVYRRAGGGSATAGRTYWVGENGPELLHMGANGYVTNAAVSKAAMQPAAGPSVQQPIQVVVSARPGTDSELVRWLLPKMQIEIVGQGGTVQEVLGSPTR